MLNKVSFEQRIIADILSENEAKRNKALKILYKRFYPMVLRFVRQKNGTVNDAEDIFQDAMIVLYKNIRLGQFKGESALSTYLYGIAKNVWYRCLDREYRFSNILQSISEEDSSGINRRALSDFVIDLLDRLDEVCKEVLTRFYFDCSSYEQIMYIMGYGSSSSVRTRKHLCIKKLVKIIDEDPTVKSSLKEIYI